MLRAEQCTANGIALQTADKECIFLNGEGLFHGQRSKLCGALPIIDFYLIAHSDRTSTLICPPSSDCRLPMQIVKG